MIELMYLYGVIIVILLVIEVWLLNFWAAEHALAMDLIRHTLVEIKKKLQEKDTSAKP